MNIKEQEHNIQASFAVSDFFQLLSLSLQFPSKDLTTALLDGSYRQDAINILTELSSSKEDILEIDKALGKLQEMIEDEVKFINQMCQEYTRLFNDPKQPVLNIYESIFLYKPETKNEKPMLFLSPTSLDAERCYKVAGVNLVSKSSEPADHMSTELEFMMYLYREKGKALQEEDIEGFEKIEQQIQQFEKLHLGKWSYEFFDRLETQSRKAPYKALAQLAKVGLEQVRTNTIDKELVR